MGDFNSPDINWQTFASTTVSSDHLCNLIIDHNLFQLVDVPTHIYGNILDLIITKWHWLNWRSSCSPSFWLFIRIEPFYNSFLNLYFDSVYRYSRRNEVKCTHSFNKANWYGLNQFIAMNTGDTCFYSDDIETAWSRLKDILCQSMDMFIPKKQQHLSSRPQWFTPEIRHHLNKLHTTCKKSNEIQQNTTRSL